MVMLPKCAVIRFCQKLRSFYIFFCFGSHCEVNEMKKKRLLLCSVAKSKF